MDETILKSYKIWGCSGEASEKQRGERDQMWKYSMFYQAVVKSILLYVLYRLRYTSMVYIFIRSTLTETFK